MIHLSYSHHIFLEQKVGGVSRYIYELATRVAQDPDFEVSVVAPLYVNHYLRQAPRGLVRGMHMPDLQFRGAWRLRRLIKAIQSQAIARAYRSSGTDIIHESYYSRVPYGHARRRVVTVHDMIHELLTDYFPEGPRMEAHATKRAAILRADHVICVSEATRRDLVRLLDVDIGKTSVVYHGVNPVPAGGVYRLSSGKPFLLYVGKRDGYKNFRALCLAYAASASLGRGVDVVAFGGGAFTAAEQQLFAELGIRERMHHADGADEELNNHYRGARAFVYPSMYEGFGLPPLEAMAAGCPVACSNRGSIPEVVADAGLYFDPADVDDMRQALESIVSDGLLRERLVAAGTVRAASFSWERCASQTMDIYRSLV